MAPDVTRSRYIRGVLLEFFWKADGAGSGFGFSWDDLRNSFRTRLEVGESELRRELNDLVDEQLVNREFDDDLNCHMYTLAARGRDFKRAGCPWDKLDEFTGKQAV